MHFLKMIFLRGELMRINFDVGSVTVQELVYAHYTKKIWKTAYFDTFYRIFRPKNRDLVIQQMANLCPFSDERVRE